MHMHTHMHMHMHHAPCTLHSAGVSTYHPLIPSLLENQEGENLSFLCFGRGNQAEYYSPVMNISNIGHFSEVFGVELVLELESPGMITSGTGAPFCSALSPSWSRRGLPSGTRHIETDAKELERFECGHLALLKPTLY